MLQFRIHKWCLLHLYSQDALLISKPSCGDKKKLLALYPLQVLTVWQGTVTVVQIFPFHPDVVAIANAMAEDASEPSAPHVHNAYDATADATRWDTGPPKHTPVTGSKPISDGAFRANQTSGKQPVTSQSDSPNVLTLY